MLSLLCWCFVVVVVVLVFRCCWCFVVVFFVVVVVFVVVVFNIFVVLRQQQTRVSSLKFATMLGGHKPIKRTKNNDSSSSYKFLNSNFMANEFMNEIFESKYSALM